MMSRKSASQISFSQFSMQPVSTPSTSPIGNDTTSRWFDVLPPVGAPIPYSSIIASVWDSVRGNTHSRYETLHSLLTEMTGLPHWLFLDSGRSALSAVMMGLHARRPDCDEVIIPAYTSYSVPAAVVRAGLKITLCDVEGETLGLDPDALKSCITSRTLCIVPHHLYGLPCRIADLWAISRDHGLPLIEDAAQGMGITAGGRAGGTHGTAGVFSLSRGKNLPAAGGGVIGTTDADLAKVCRSMVQPLQPRRAAEVREAVEASLMAVFIRPSLYWLPAGLPFLKLGQSWFEPHFDITRMSNFQGALFSRLLPNLTPIRRIREEQALRLRRALDHTSVRFLWPRTGDEGAFLRAPVVLRDRAAKDHALSQLRRLGLGATEGYPLALSQLPELRPSLRANRKPCPTAEWISDRLVTLPTHHWVADRHRQIIAEVLTQCR